MSFYFDELCQAMSLLAKSQGAVFLGQSVLFPGTAMFNTLKHIDPAKRLELPVFEDCQLGMAIGMSLNGMHPVCCLFPRINFLLLATSQLVLHLDVIPRYSEYRPRVIVRTAIATPEPLNPGPQHLGDHSLALRSMLKTVAVVNLDRAEDIVPAYKVAMEREYSTLLIEHAELYNK